MNLQNNETSIEDAASVIEAPLTDLALLDDEELDGIKGGPPLPGGEDGGGGRTGGDWIINHNETTVGDQDEEAPLADLALLDDEELDGIKGGPPHPGVEDGGGGRTGGDWIINHNEMILREE